MPGFNGYTLANELLNLVYRNQAITIGATLYLRLLVVPSSRSGGGTETNYGNYARLALPRDTSTIWTISPVNGLLVNGVELEFPTAASAGNGDLVAFDIVDTVSGAFTKLYNGGPIVPPKAIVVGRPPVFDEQKLQITY